MSGQVPLFFGYRMVPGILFEIGRQSKLEQQREKNENPDSDPDTETETDMDSDFGMTKDWVKSQIDDKKYRINPKQRHRIKKRRIERTRTKKKYFFHNWKKSVV